MASTLLSAQSANFPSAISVLQVAYELASHNETQAFDHDESIDEISAGVATIRRLILEAEPLCIRDLAIVSRHAAVAAELLDECGESEAVKVPWLRSALCNVAAFLGGLS